MTDLDSIIDDYVKLEQDVQALMNRICAPFCAGCQNCCCRYDICEESLQAPFLCLLREKIPATDSLSDSYGWLTPSGCCLPIGRPPVCYEFLCDGLMHGLPGDSARYALRTLGMLLTFVGRNAIGQRHLVEIMERGDLDKMKYDRFQKRIQQARAALRDVRYVLDNGDGSSPTESMLKICSPDIDLFQGP